MASTSTRARSTATARMKLMWCAMWAHIIMAPSTWVGTQWLNISYPLGIPTPWIGQRGYIILVLAGSPTRGTSKWHNTVASLRSLTSHRNQVGNIGLALA